MFEGTWTSIDPLDGSRQTLTVGPGKTPAVRYEDDLATGGACDLDEVKYFTADGTGEIAGNRLDVLYPDGGGCGLMTVYLPHLYYLHDPGTDTLRDDVDLTASFDPAVAEGHLTAVWSRVPDADALSTQPPVTDRPTDQPPGTGQPPTDQPPESTPPELTPPESTPPVSLTSFPPYTCDLTSGTYHRTVGSLQVFATTPTTWHGLEDVFHAEDDSCGGGGAVRLEIALVSQVYADACLWRGTGVDIDPTTAALAFAEQELGTIGPTEATIAGYAALRFQFAVPSSFDTTICDDEYLQLWRDPERDEGTGPTVFPRDTVSVYFVDVDGVALGLYAIVREDATPVMIDELDAVVASLRLNQRAEAGLGPGTAPAAPGRGPWLAAGSRHQSAGRLGFSRSPLA